MFVWSTSLDYKLVGEFHPDVVICAMIEGFVTRLLGDTFDIRRYVEEVRERGWETR